MYHLRPNRQKRSLFTKLILIFSLIGVLLGSVVVLYQIPTIRENVDWRISNLRSSIKYALFPPEEAVFIPNPTALANVQATMDAFTPTPSPTYTSTVTPGPT